MTSPRWIRVACALLLLVPGLARAEYSGWASPFPRPNDQQMLGGGLGVTVIDGQAYYLVNLSPEFSFGRLGIGVDLNLRFNATTGRLRSQDYKSAADYFRAVRYLEWAGKGDPLYLRVGELDYAELGHGFIMYNYCNSPSNDLRKWGGEVDINREKFGFEAIYSDLFGRYGPGVFGARPYVRPLRFTPVGETPIIGGMEIGATYAADYNSNANIVFNPVTQSTTRKSSLAIYGADVGFPLLSGSSLRSTLYFDVARIQDFGHGSAAGVDVHAKASRLLTLDAKYERRFLGDRFLPSYFDMLYEYDRYAAAPGTASGFVSKADSLPGVKASQGYYGELRVGILNTFNVLGGYSAPLDVRNQGVFHAVVEAPKVVPSIVLDGGYDRQHIGTFFKADENSLLYAEAGYRLNRFLILSTLYEWTYTRDSSGRLVPQRRIEPKLSFAIDV